MTLVSVTTGVILHLRTILACPVFPQDQNIDTSELPKYIKATIRRADTYMGVGGDIKENFIIILAVFMCSPENPTADAVNPFDVFVQQTLTSLQDRQNLDLLLQRSGLHLELGVTDMQDHPFSRSEPGHFQKIITLIITIS